MVLWNGKVVNILVVDDNPGDVLLLQELLSGTRNPNHVHVARNGLEALAFMRGENGHTEVTTPDLVILDIEMPRMNGIEVLREMRADPRTVAIPVIILTSTDDDEIVRNCYELHANCFLTKPVTWGDLDHLVRSIDEFWLSAVKFPPTLPTR